MKRKFLSSILSLLIAVWLFSASQADAAPRKLQAANARPTGYAVHKETNGPWGKVRLLIHKEDADSIWFDAVAIEIAPNKGKAKVILLPDADGGLDADIDVKSFISPSEREIFLSVATGGSGGFVSSYIVQVGKDAPYLIFDVDKDARYKFKGESIEEYSKMTPRDVDGDNVCELVCVGVYVNDSSKSRADGMAAVTLTLKYQNGAWKAVSDGSAPAAKTSRGHAYDQSVLAPGEVIIFDNWNIDGVRNGPSADTTFELAQSVTITYIDTYHYFNGGSRAGSIMLTNQNGTQYGPWRAEGQKGQGGVVDASWHVYPNVTLPPGRYKISDTDEGTWSHNSTSGGRGFAQVRGVPVSSASPPETIKDFKRDWAEFQKGFGDYKANPPKGAARIEYAMDVWGDWKGFYLWFGREQSNPVYHPFDLRITEYVGGEDGGNRNMTFDFSLRYKVNTDKSIESNREKLAFGGSWGEGSGSIYLKEGYEGECVFWKQNGYDRGMTDFTSPDGERHRFMFYRKSIR
ncbi:hypothetical protein FACS1894204_01100 [Synergistales bacterium]|nr:hypothetical protein FACS1894204_01100 [Synergistales bacterium]